MTAYGHEVEFGLSPRAQPVWEGADPVWSFSPWD